MDLTTGADSTDIASISPDLIIASDEGSSVFDIEKRQGTSTNSETAPDEATGPAVIGVPESHDSIESESDSSVKVEPESEESIQHPSTIEAPSGSDGSPVDSTHEWKSLEKDLGLPASPEERKAFWRDKMLNQQESVKEAPQRSIRLKRDLHKSYPAQIEKVRSKLGGPPRTQPTFPYLQKQVDHEEYLLRQLVHQLEFGSLDSSIMLLERLVQFYP
ncbi:MAG: hypothetical protein K2Z81_26795, partial [Cyanobacteria bacterium]|nr:hypothetical protein [Cyanobacteriota bacterium]